MKNEISKIVYVVEDEKSAQFRYMVKNVIESLEESEKWKAEYCLKKDIEKIDLSGVKILVIVRQTAKDGVVLRLIKRAQECGIKVLMALDDLVFDYGDLRLVANTVGEKNMVYWFGYFWGVRRIAKRVDGFVTTNGFLAKKLKRSFKKPVKIIRNSLNKEQIEISKKYLKNKEDAKDEGRRFLIGYFSGSPTHVRDFRIAEPGLVRFLREHDDARLDAVGYMNFSKETETLKREGKIRLLDYMDYRKLQEEIAKVDVNIAPLVINDFTNSKSELKFFEAAIVETTTIASPSYAFKNAIQDGKDGYLAKPEEWYAKLEYLYSHPKENRQIAKSAKEYALEHYFGKEYREEIEEAYEYFAN